MTKIAEQDKIDAIQMQDHAENYPLPAEGFGRLFVKNRELYLGTSLGANPVARTLYGYWDVGGGIGYLNGDYVPQNEVVTSGGFLVGSNSLTLPATGVIHLTSEVIADVALLTTSAYYIVASVYHNGSQILSRRMTAYGRNSGEQEARLVQSVFLPVLSGDSIKCNVSPQSGSFNTALYPPSSLSILYVG